MTRNFRAKKDKWLDRPVDTGFAQLRQRSKIIDDEEVIYFVREPIVDAAGLKIQRPWPLDGEGKAKLSAIDPPAELEFRPYRSASWASLLLA